jgi:hypothetical protein
MPDHLPMTSVSRSGGVAVAAVVLSFIGCASTTLDAQWSDPQFTGASLRGARVMVVCESSDFALKRICQDQFASELTAHGATPLIAPDDPGPAAGARAAERYLPVARSAGAKAVLSAAVAPDAFAVSPGYGSSVGFGVGGWGGSGGRGVATGVGVGVSMPVGSSQTGMAYVANSTFTDVATGRPMWTAKASTPAASNVNEQLGELAKAVVAAAQKAGLF